MNTSVLHTADQAVNIRVTADKKVLKADNEDLSYITVELVDNNGNVNPKAETLMSFTVTGDAKIIGVGNANPVSLESFQQPYRKTWKGRCLVVVKAGKTAGNIILTAQSNGLKPVRLSLLTKREPG